MGMVRKHAVSTGLSLLVTISRRLPCGLLAAIHTIRSAGCYVLRFGYRRTCVFEF